MQNATGQPVPEPFDLETRRAIKNAIARDAYARNIVRIIDPVTAGHDWLVASHRGVFAVATDKAKMVIRGWFFGIHREGDTIYLFENCGLRDRSVPLGRIVRITLSNGRLVAPKVLATGLNTNCHQVAMINGLLCVVDSPGQAILRFTRDGTPVDVKYPFPVASPSDSSGAYLHLNSIAKVGSRIGIMLHNGPAVPRRQSELAWLDNDWNVVSRYPIEGHCCHDIVEDEHGVLWHSASMSGEVMSSDGRRLKITDGLMTRGIALSPDAMIVGVSTFGPRQIRDGLGGGVVILDRQLRHVAKLDLSGSPTDVIFLG